MKPNIEVRGGTKLARALHRKLMAFSSVSRVSVGLPAGSGDHDGIPLVVIGAVQEFGSADGHIPERSFLRVPIRQNQDNLRKAFATLAKKVASGELSSFQMLSQIGARAVGYCQEAISEGIAPANAPSTVERKGSSTPLIDTGALRQAITYVVDNGKEGS
ncbi:hypothetical protein AAF302_001116 [Pluralibacter gergoviae]